MNTKSPTAVFQIKRIGNVTFNLSLRKGRDVVNQNFTLEELPIITDGIERRFDLDATPIVDQLKGVFGEDLINEYFKVPVGEWTYFGSKELPTYFRH